MDRSRLEAFSDGVFAVAITLLALNLTVAGPGHGRLLHLLGHAWPAFAAYVVSFFTIGVIWVNHRSLFSGLARIDRLLLFLNLLLLLFVVAIPFTTATLADYLTAGGSNAHVAAALYGAVMAGMGISFALIFGWALRRGHMIKTMTAKDRSRAELRFGVGTVVYLIGVGVSFLSAPAALVCYGAVAVYYVLERTPAEPTVNSK
ncbi:MAG TPA: TMEM175 family protein [Acidimicrobiales bacterium]|nr:TMEM175 family protein [Acidimicrobiales bacterium]